MTHWHDRVLAQLTPGVHPLALVLDADRVLAEEGVLARIRDRGFDVVRFEDAVAFRYAHESGFRASLDRREAANLVVAFGAEVADSLPFDLLQAVRRISLGLRELFPTLSQAVVATMEPADFDALHEAVERHRPGVLGETATKDFVPVPLPGAGRTRTGGATPRLELLRHGLDDDLVMLRPDALDAEE